MKLLLGIKAAENSTGTLFIRKKVMVVVTCTTLQLKEDNISMLVDRLNLSN
jgi:hypothetical protein